jgi:glycosyltransferase involved in cell wall biosynthesis
MVNTGSTSRHGAHRSLRVLIVTYFYPPMGGGGVQRILKFTRYLPDYGIVPTVVCASNETYPQDASLLADIPANLEIFRIPHVPMTTRLLALRRRWSAPSKTDGKRSSPGQLAGRGAEYAWHDRLWKAWNALQRPDDKASWAGRAERVALRAISARPVDIVVSSSPPVSAHLAGMHVAARARLPWVADYRDLWTSNPSYAAPAWRRKLDQRMERNLLHAADGLVTVSESMRAALGVRVRQAVPSISIPNGYDEADFADVAPGRPRGGRFRIIHAGSLYGHQSPVPFLGGVQQWLDANPAMIERLQICLVGSVGSRFEAALGAFARRYPGVLDRRGYLEHHEALRELASADALLLLIGGGESARGVTTGKVFEYLRIGRPILLVGPPEGEAAQLIRDAGAGEIAREDDRDSVGAILSRWVLQGGASEPNPERALPYERKLLTGQLADFLHEVHARFHARG